MPKARVITSPEAAACGLDVVERARIARRNACVLANQGLIHAIARAYHARRRHRNVPYDDLTQAGQLGLIRAAELFDETRGLAFSTYATSWIRQAMAREAERAAWPIRLPAYLHYHKAAALAAPAAYRAAAARIRVARVEPASRLDELAGERADRSSDSAPPLGGLIAREQSEQLRLAVPRLRDGPRAVVVRWCGLDGAPAVALADQSRAAGKTPRAAYHQSQTATRALRVYLCVDRPSSDPKG